jgi:hypothetical protein
MGHELGHNVLFKLDEVFAPEFNRSLDCYTNKLQRTSLADKGTAKQQARRNVDEIRQLWGPSPNHLDWSHEIAADLIAFWTCGPAYIAALLDVLEDDGLNPFKIGPGHPPYEVRANALLYTGESLGWETYLSDLRDLVGQWRVSSTWRRERNNRYVMNANPELIRECVGAALAACTALGLPQLTPAAMENVTRMLDRGTSPELGSELLVAAWLQRSRTDEESFAAWERATVEELSAQITL